MFVVGTSTSSTPVNYGTFNFATDNAFAASPISGLKGVAGDVTNNGIFDPADKNAFIAGWLHKQVVNGVQIGDMASHAQGDLNLDGITNIQDLLLMQNALTGAGLGAITAAELSGVPEPATALLAALAMLPLAIGRRRSRLRLTWRCRRTNRSVKSGSLPRRSCRISYEDSMPTRREFLQQAAILSSAAAWSGAFPAAIAKALTIDPEPGSTFLDAEHVVILMQENRSFDHAFGTLKGVRGYNDPRAITLPDGNPVWVQTNRRGESYAPFRLNIKDSNATWLGSLPHGRTDQVDARNGGRYDRWLDVKRSGDGYAAHALHARSLHARGYSVLLCAGRCLHDLRSAFLLGATCTTPNRLFLWSGTVREKQTADSPAKLNNEEAIYDAEVSWPTFPERLEDHGISWKVYQNEVWLAIGVGRRVRRLAREFRRQSAGILHAVQRSFCRAAPPSPGGTRKTCRAKSRHCSKRSRQTSPVAKEDPLEKQLADKSPPLRQTHEELPRCTAENYEKLSPREKSIHAKAFSNNAADPDYRQLVTHKYDDSGKQHEVYMPKGDVFQSFREDVRTGQLPTVSWLVAPERFSDHPGSAWYGAWYIAEAINILTQNPDVWKKTIFILTYDENDGYFDHVPPFVAPHPRSPGNGAASPRGIDTSVEYVDRSRSSNASRGNRARESSIGLGYRVPMIIASPWSRGGCVCSQVFDHTSVLQFLERLLTHKTGRQVEEPNISPLAADRMRRPYFRLPGLRRTGKRTAARCRTKRGHRRNPPGKV